MRKDYRFSIIYFSFLSDSVLGFESGNKVSLALWLILVPVEALLNRKALQQISSTLTRVA
jgi:hypothetical protein